MKGGESVKKEFFTSGAKFVYSKDELGYQEVLDNFENAFEITIITFNINNYCASPVFCFLFFKKCQKNKIMLIFTIIVQF